MGFIHWALASTHTDYTFVSGSLLGLIVHHFLFIRGEWHLWAPRVLTIHLILPILLFAIQLLLRSVDLKQCFVDTLRGTVSYFITVLSSITIYRLFFHRLRHFPGPWQASVSKLWHVWHIRDGKNHLFLDRIRKQYGDFVRTGPNEMTIFHPDIHRMVDGPGNTCKKSAWYDVVHPDQSLVTARDKIVHDKRRRLWFRGLGPNSMAVYDRRMLDYVDQLCAILEVSHERGNPVNVSDVFFWFCWDVMGETTFGKSFDMLINEKWHGSIVVLKRALSILGIMSPAQWSFHIAFKYLSGRWVVKDWQMMREMCRQVVEERLQNEQPKEDIFTSLIADARENNLAEDDYRFLTGDAVIGLVAGSDPPAATMVFLFSHLARNQKMQDELARQLLAYNTRDTRSLQSCEYLTSLVNETLRLYPPLMTGGSRDTGPEGLKIGGTFIPGGVTVVSPRFSISRLESCFLRPDEFLPERWLNSPELNPYAKAFNPFGIGSHSCVGKNIVWSQVRLATAAIVSRYVVKLAPGENGTRAFDDFRDFVAPTPGRLDLVFERRRHL